MKTNDIDVNEILERGRKWEELGRFGDAVLAYKIGLEAHHNHRELLKRQGQALARIEARVDCSLQASMRAAQAALQKGDQPTVLLQLHNVSTILAQQKDITPNTFIDTLARIGLIYEKTGDLRMFALNLADVCAYAELHFPSTRDTAMDYHYLSDVLEKLGNYSDARRMQERAAFHFQSTNDWTKYEAFHLKRMESLQAKADTANGPNLLATYILRERTTPSEEEAKNYLLNCLHSIYPQNDVDALLRRSRIDQCTNLTQSGDVSKMMDGFIRGSGNEQFLDFPTHYEIKYFQIQTGTPAEPTCIALVFGPDPEQFDPHLVDAASIAASQGDTQNAARLLRRAQEQGVIQDQPPHKAPKRGLVGRLRDIWGGTLNQGRTFPKDLNTTSCPKCKIPYSITTFSKQVAVAYPNPNRGELLPIRCSECDFVAEWRYQGEWESASKNQHPLPHAASGSPQIRPVCVIVIEGDRKLTGGNQLEIVKMFVESGQLKSLPSETRFCSINLSYTPASEVDPKFLNLVINRIIPTFPEIGPYFDTSETHFEKRSGVDMEVLHASISGEDHTGQQVDILVHLLYIYPAKA